MKFKKVLKEWSELGSETKYKEELKKGSIISRCSYCGKDYEIKPTDTEQFITNYKNWENDSKNANKDIRIPPQYKIDIYQDWKAEHKLVDGSNDHKDGTGSEEGTPNVSHGICKVCMPIVLKM